MILKKIWKMMDILANNNYINRTRLKTCFFLVKKTMSYQTHYFKPISLNKLSIDVVSSV